MQPWVQGLVILCLIAITIALVPAIIALRRSAERADRVLAIFEGELRPLFGEVRGLVHELRGLSEEARGEMQRIGGLTARAADAGEWLDKSREMFEEQTQRLMNAFEAGKEAMREEIRKWSTSARG